MKSVFNFGPLARERLRAALPLLIAGAVLAVFVLAHSAWRKAQLQAEVERVAALLGDHVWSLDEGAARGMLDVLVTSADFRELAVDHPEGDGFVAVALDRPRSMPLLRLDTFAVPIERNGDVIAWLRGTHLDTSPRLYLALFMALTSLSALLQLALRFRASSRARASALRDSDARYRDLFRSATSLAAAEGRPDTLLDVEFVATLLAPDEASLSAETVAVFRRVVEGRIEMLRVGWTDERVVHEVARELAIGCAQYGAAALAAAARQLAQAAEHGVHDRELLEELQRTYEATCGAFEVLGHGD